MSPVTALSHPRADRCRFGFPDKDVVYSALGFFRNLLVPERNRGPLVSLAVPVLRAMVDFPQAADVQEAGEG